MTAKGKPNRREELHPYEETDLAEDFDPAEDSDLAKDFDPALYPRTYRMSLGWRLAPRVYPVVVAAKHVDQDSKWTTWYLTLNPWGPMTESKDVSVSAARYRLTEPGDTVCVMLRSGSFQIAWYRVAACNETRSEERGK